MHSTLIRLREAFTLGGLSVTEVLRRTWKAIQQYEIMTRAAAMAFYAMLAVVPFLALVLTLAVQLLPDGSCPPGSEGSGNIGRRRPSSRPSRPSPRRPIR